MAAGMALGLVSAAAIALEVVLLRLFSITLWSHFAWMIISMAMLGYGASGAMVAAVGERAAGAMFRPLFTIFAGIFGIFTVAGYKLAGAAGFNPLELLWDPWQKWRLALVYLSLFVPFCAAASCVGLCFARMGGEAGRVYLYDLAGAGLGAVAVVAAMYHLAPWRIPPLLGMAAFAAGGIVFLDRRMGTPRPGVAAAMAAAGLAGALLLPETALRPAISPYKGLSMALSSPTARVLGEESGPLALLTVVQNNQVPFRYAPGLSLMDRNGPPEQLAVFLDAGAMTPITGSGGAPDRLEFLDNLTWAVPYHLAKDPSTLILGAGGGMDTLMALRLGAGRIDAVEINPGLAALARDRYAGFGGEVFSDPKVTLHISEGRRFVSVTNTKYGIIQAPLLDSFGGAVSGAGAVTESYLYTVEAMEEYLARLEPGGWLAVTRWLGATPKDILKLTATAAVALERMGADPAARTAIINSWNTATLLVKNGAITQEDIQIIRAFCQSRGFDTAYYPGIKPGEANVRHAQQEAYIYQGAMELLGKGRGGFIRDYKFDIVPATDARPYFFNFFRYSSFPELWRIGRQGGYTLMEHGYLTLLMALVQAAIFIPALAAPVAALSWRRSTAELGLARVGGYFTLLGLAFMLLEMSFIQKLALFLGSPAFSAAVVLASFLVFAGIGSRCSMAMAPRLTTVGINPVAVAAGGVAAFTLAHMVLAPAAFHAAWKAPEWVRFLVAALSVAPMAFFMGMPFPLMMTTLAGKGAGLIPWAWTANGLASTMGAMMGTALSVHFGFNAVAALALGLYAMAAALAAGFKV